MSFPRASTVFIMVVMMLSRSVFAQAMTQQSFESNFYALSQISYFGLDKTRYDSLTTAQRNSVLRARGVLLAVLKALQDREGRTAEYLTDSLNKEFPTKRSFAQSLLDDETSLIGLIVTDFAIDGNNKRIELTFSAIVSTEGTIITAKKKAVLVGIGSSWKLASIS